MPTRSTRRRAVDTPAARHVSAYSILRADDEGPAKSMTVGRIVVASPIRGNGMGAALADVHIFGGVLAFRGHRADASDTRETFLSETGSASGCGYNKHAGAIVDALMRAREGDPERFAYAHEEKDGGEVAYKAMTHGGGFSPIRDYLSALGYVVVEVL